MSQESDRAQCFQCKYARDTEVFNLCIHESSQYKSNDGIEHHTRNHIIKLQGGECKNYSKENAK